MNGSINKIETFGLLDGPGIRTVIFLNGCNLRCKFCHNPETWLLKEKNYTPQDILKICIKNKPYFKRNNGGVTFSGGEPLLQYDFLLETCKLLKKQNIHITLDTSGIGINDDYQELLKYIDLILLDIKAINKEDFINITNKDYFDKYINFIKQLNISNKPIWIRQVIIPDVNDNLEYINNLSNFIKNNINNVNKIDFLPYHTLGHNKYVNLNINEPYLNKNAMDKEKCDELLKQFNIIYNK